MLQLLAEPPRTRYDWNFHCLNVPVRVTPWFWLAGAILGMRGDAITLILFIGGAFISILVHEMGHALVMRRFGETPRVVLLMTGGLAISDVPAYLPQEAYARGARQQILISLAGPAAGFVLAAIVLLGAFLAGATFEFGLPLSIWANFASLVREDGSNAHGIDVLTKGVNVLLWINIYWGVMNLMPVYPLDGGQVARELFTLRNPHTGMIRSLWLSVATGAVIGIVALYFGSMFLGLLFGMLAVSSYQTLSRFQGPGYGGGYGGGGYDDGYGKPW